MNESKENKPIGRPKKSDGKEPYKGTAFHSRLNKVFGDSKESQDAAAKAFGVSRQSFGNWLQGRNQPDFDTLIKIAEYYGVSTDYLLGKCDEKSTDKDIKAACAVTGLSEEAIQSVVQFNEKHSLEDLNFILKSPYFAKILDDFAYTRAQKKLLYNKDGSNREEVSNAYFDELGIEQTGRAGRLHIDLVLNGIEYIYKQKITENTIKLFDEFKDYVLSLPCYSYPVCLYYKSRSYTVTVPDLPINAVEGKTVLDVINAAIDAASGYVLAELADGREVPEPSPIDKVKAGEKEGDYVTRMITLKVKRAL